MPNETDEQNTTLRAFTYDGIIPKLGPKREGDMYPSLLPLQGGQPGLEYLQAPVGRVRAWEDDQWLRVQDTRDYTIVGPEGSVDCALLVRGKQIHGIDPNSSRRPLSLDKEIGRVTGLDVRTGTVNAPAETTVELSDPAEPSADEISAVLAFLKKRDNASAGPNRDPENGAPVAASETKKSLDAFKTHAKETKSAKK